MISRAGTKSSSQTIAMPTNRYKRPAIRATSHNLSSSTLHCSASTPLHSMGSSSVIKARSSLGRALDDVRSTPSGALIETSLPFDKKPKSNPVFAFTAVYTIVTSNPTEKNKILKGRRSRLFFRLLKDLPIFHYDHPKIS